MTDLDIVRADVVPAPRDRWDAYVEAWASSQRSPQTERAYRIDERQWRDWCAGRGVHPVSAVRTHVDMWAGHLRDRGGYGGRPAAAKTVARKLAALASLYGYLVDEGVLLHSPTAHVKRPRVSKDYAATISLDEGQLQRVVDAAFEEGRTAHAFVAVLAYTGARVSEVLGCRVTDLVDDHGYRCLNVTRKGGESDRVALPPSAAHAVTAYVGDRADGPLFVSSGRPLTYPAVLALMARLTRRAGLPPGMSLHPHVFRASFATISFDHGVPLDRLQDAMGHADPRTTRGYDRGRGKLKRKAEPGLVVARYVTLKTFDDDDEEVDGGVG